jgi:small-conductance mechanosensitive channel
MAKTKTVEVAKSLHDKIQDFAIVAATGFFFWTDWAWSWIFSRWDKWIHVVIMLFLVYGAYAIGSPALAIAAFFFAVGYGLGWFIAKVKHDR